jgi:hypothetical protein
MLGIVTNGKTCITIQLALQWDPERQAYIGPLEGQPCPDGTPIVIVSPTALLKTITVMAATGDDITAALDPNLWKQLIGNPGVSQDIEPHS